MPSLPALPAPKVCCVFQYDEYGNPADTPRTCEQIAAGDTAAEAACVALDGYVTEAGMPIFVPHGSIEECCRDCNPLPVTLIRVGNKLMRRGGELNRSPNAEPEKCCCGDVGVCKPVPDCDQVRCFPSPPDPEEQCKGKCVDNTSSGAGSVVCATNTQCCGDDGTTCVPTCANADPGATPPTTAVYYSTAHNSWEAMPCTTCGVCCVNNYDEDPTSLKFRQVLSTTGVKDKTEAECNASHPFIPDPANPFGSVGVWHAATDNVNICNPNCCQQQIRGDEKAAVCAPTSAPVCDPCLGRCIEIEYENNPAKCPREECKSKQECCGDGDENCVPQCGETTAKYRWESGCGDGTKCGKCCKNIYNDDGTAVTGVECDATKLNQTDCVALIEHLSGPKPYGVWFPFGTCADCNATPCCREVTCPGGLTDTVCVDVAADDCDLCKGTCLDIATGNKTCTHYRVCCGPNGENCETVCGIVATNSWTANGCTDPNLCGACCRSVYDGPAGTATMLSAECVPAITRAADCVLNNDDRAALAPDHDIRYSWKPFETCATAKCATKQCCGDKCLDDVGCIDIDINAECEPCNGRCYDNATETATCQTKQDCCGPDGSLCRGCPGDGGDVAPTPAAFSWGGCFENGTKCGVCCVITRNALGVAVSSTCVDDETYAQCVARGADASWQAFETCASAVCIPRTCCNEVACPGIVMCLAVDKDRGACDAPCRGECYAIDESGAQAGPPFCATKVSCCGDLNEDCEAQNGLCPDGSVLLPTYSWPNDCADPAVCGVCCKRNVGAGGAISFSCDATKANQTDCEAANFGVWHAFATCAACGDTKQACVESTCRKIVNGIAQTYTNAVCRPVPPDKTTCKGICTDLATTYTTCKTKSECCGSDNGKCGVVCGSVATHSWSSSCNDPDQCGVCCITTNIGDGNITAGQPQENIGRAACAALNMANGGIGVSSNWIPFGVSQDCSVEKCCGSCPDGSISCIAQPPGMPCPQPCNGRCVDSTGNVSCKTKAECCLDENGNNLCDAPPDSRCPAKPFWTATCPENAIKCGVACKTTYGAGNVILTSACQPAITTYTAFLLAQAGAPAGTFYTWHAWDTCETVICRSKVCCKDICPDVKGCATVDYSDPCVKCGGLCYDAIVTVNPVTNVSTYSIDPDGSVSCLTRTQCCGVANESCSAIPNCPKAPKVFVPCDNENCPPSSNCLCTSPNYATNNWPGDQGGGRIDAVFNANAPPLTITEQCYSYLSPVNNVEDIVMAYSTYSTEDPCLLTCDQFIDDFDAYGQCRMIEEQKYTAALAWKPCYPGLLTGQQLYTYQEWNAFFWLNTTIRDSRDGTWLRNGQASALAIYMCDGEKLVDVTDTILEKLPVKKCQEASGSGAFGSQAPGFSNRQNVEIPDVYNYTHCIAYKFTPDGPGAIYENSIKYETCPHDWQTPCSAFSTPSSEVKDPDMINCPAAFTANPLP